MDQAMIGALAATQPAQQDRDELMLFGQFVGSWALDLTCYLPNGTGTTEHGEWSFGWILQGHAIQDVWRVPPKAETHDFRRYGTSVRFYDREIGAWRSTWHGLHDGRVLQFLARRVDDEIVLERLEAGRTTRWIFSNITSRTFSWRNVYSDGKGWVLEQEMQLRRLA
jgi:hypothetical protein